MKRKNAIKHTKNKLKFQIYIFRKKLQLYTVFNFPEAKYMLHVIQVMGIIVWMKQTKTSTDIKRK